MKQHNVTPVHWAGSKVFQLPNIYKALPEQFSSIVEPFAGSAALSLALLDEGRDGLESVWLNDTNKALVDFWCALRDKPIEMYHHLMKARDHYGLGTETLHKFAKDMSNDRQADDYKRGVCFYIYNRLCIAMRQGDKNFAHPLISKKGLRADSIVDLRRYAELLKGVDITCGDYQKVHGDSGTLMFCDPPYDIGDKKISSMYGAKFNHAKFAKWCKSMKDKCYMLITLDDSPNNRNRFKGWNIFRYPVYYGSRKDWDTELIITNYAVPFADVWVKESGWRIVREAIGSPTIAANDSSASMGAAA